MVLSFLYYAFIFFFGGRMQYSMCKYGILNPQIWSFYGDINNLNVALPDAYATYRGSFLCLIDHDIIELVSEVPNSTYYSFQIYDSKGIALNSLNDEQLIIRDNKIKVLISKNDLSYKSYENYIYVNSKNSFFVILFRNYNENTIPSYPIIYRHDSNNITYNLTISKSVPNLFYPQVIFDILPVNKYHGYNIDNNFFKSRTRSYFSNQDASYLLSMIKLNDKRLGAIITGYLPVTYFENKTNYDIRYISFNLGLASFPLSTLSGNMLNKKNSKPGISDKDIINKYNSSWLKKDRKYIIYIGEDYNHINELGGNHLDDLYILFPRQYISEKLFTHIVIIYRNLLPKHRYGINKIKDLSNSEVCQNVMGLYYPKIKFI